MTGFMLDTDISSYIIKRRPATLVEKFEKHGETAQRVRDYGCGVAFWRSEGARPKLVELVEAYLDRLAILDWTNEVSHHYARIRSELERSGKPIGDMDLLIASHAVSQGMIVVTNNLKHFSNVPGLKVEMWS